MNREQNELKIPRHVAIIMDGNGRWAELRGEPRTQGHLAGVESVRRAIKAALRNGVRYLTLYAFSTENWGRPAEEVDALMELLCRCVIDETPELKNRVSPCALAATGAVFRPRCANTSTWPSAKRATARNA